MFSGKTLQLAKESFTTFTVFETSQAERSVSKGVQDTSFVPESLDSPINLLNVRCV